MDSEDVRKLDYDTIVKLFEKNGIILFRDFNLKPEEITSVKTMLKAFVFHKYIQKQFS